MNKSRYRVAVRRCFADHDIRAFIAKICPDLKPAEDGSLLRELSSAYGVVGDVDVVIFPVTTHLAGVYRKRTERNGCCLTYLAGAYKENEVCRQERPHRWSA